MLTAGAAAAISDNSRELCVKCESGVVPCDRSVTANR